MSPLLYPTEEALSIQFLHSNRMEFWIKTLNSIPMVREQVSLCSLSSLTGLHLSHHWLVCIFMLSPLSFLSFYCLVYLPATQEWTSFDSFAPGIRNTLSSLCSPPGTSWYPKEYPVQIEVQVLSSPNRSASIKCFRMEFPISHFRWSAVSYLPGAFWKARVLIESSVQG